MFKKILIANRAEIACRVIKTARRMGIATVAVYSEEDADGLHVQMADEAVPIGAAPAAESYLVIDRIVEACQATGAEAVHPGYGFLSENAAFSEALEAAGIAFIGPGQKAIRAMGDKIESKKLADAAKVTTVPGHLGVIETEDDAALIAKGVGYPVMIKASAGGGGKGMRVARNEAEARQGFGLARSEARSSFGDDRMFIEKFIEDPRHIEIQVLADKHGHCIYLGERECSIQRRHQKVIEEAPSPFLDEETRQAMGAQAVSLAKAVDYHSAGTVEFIVDRDRIFYFLEMNTRLQVEHPVTEMVTGIDLVEQMIRIAAGEKLSLAQDDVKFEGWAFECRIYAEDPYRGFLPSTGRLKRFRPPAGEGQLRIDTGVVEGSEISLYYDPMIAKLCAKGEDRAEAIAEMVSALDAFEMKGISHNINFLAAVFANDRFRGGRLSTNFIAEEFADGFDGAPLDAEGERVLAMVALFVHRRTALRDLTVSGQLSSELAPPATEWLVQGFDQPMPAEIHQESHGQSLIVSLAGETRHIDSGWRPGDALFVGEMSDQAINVLVEPVGAGFRLTRGGAEVVLTVRRPAAAALAALMPHKEPPDLSKFLLCPMPGLIVAINVEPGQRVKAGQTVAIVEAMKMENVLTAEADGTVAEVNAAAGDSLALDDVIVSFE